MVTMALPCRTPLPASLAKVLGKPDQKRAASREEEGSDPGQSSSLGPGQNSRINFPKTLPGLQFQRITWTLLQEPALCTHPVQIYSCEVPLQS